MMQQAGEQTDASVASDADLPAATSPAAVEGVVVIAALLASGLATLSLGRGAGRRLLQPQPTCPPPWLPSDVATIILVHLACQVVAASLLLPNPLPEGTVVWQQLAAGTVASLMSLAVAIPLLRIRSGSWSALQLTSRRVGGDIAVGLLMLLAITPPLLMLAGILNQIVPYHHPILDFLANERGPTGLLLTAVSAVVVAPVAEEFFFRGVLQGWLTRVAPAAAIPISAAAFGLAHLDHGLGWIPLVGFGIAAGVLARQTGSLVASIALHAGFNAIGLAAALAQLPASP